MKKFLKSCSICLIIIAMIGTTAFAAAPDNPADPQSNSYIWKTTVAIIALGNGMIEVDCGVTGTGRMEKIGILSIDFYQEGVKAPLESHFYTEPGYEYLMDYNTGSHHVGVQFQGVAGENYYAIVSFQAGKGNGSGGHQMGSAIITAT